MYAIMLALLIVGYIKFMITLIELKKVLSQELKCFFLCSTTPTVLLERTVLETMDVSFLHFYCIRKKQIYCMKCMYTVQKPVYTVYTVHAYSTGPHVH
jgi:hypothetical protein